MDAVKSILRRQTLVTVDATNYDVLVETIPSNPTPNVSSNLKNLSGSIPPLSAKTDPTEGPLHLLNVLQKVLRASASSEENPYLQLSCNLHESVRNGCHFAHILPTNWSVQSVLSYVPTFHVICTWKNNVESEKTMSEMKKQGRK